MEVDNNTIVIMLLAVGFLGTLWNYIRLKRALGKFWKLNDPSLSKSEIRSILNTIIEVNKAETALDELKVLKKEINSLVEGYDDRIKTTLKNYLSSVKTLLNVLGDIYEVADPKVRELMDNKLSTVQEAADGFNKSQALWPELFVLGVEGEDEDES